MILLHLALEIILVPQNPPSQVRELPELIVTASRVAEDPFELARSTLVLSQEQLTRNSASSLIDSLDRSVGIWIEKRTATTSDIVLRGLSGGNVLALIDGNTLSTFWGEGGNAGDDMYGKIEAESIERIEIVRGPASVQYGSNALGGVINFLTRRPSLIAPAEGLRHKGRYKVGYGTINEMWMVRMDQELAIPDFRLRIGGTLRQMGSAQGGNDVGTLEPSGGRDKNLDFNGDWTLSPADRLEFSGQFIQRRGVKRYYRPTQTNENDRTGLRLSYIVAADDDTNIETKLYYQWKEDRRDFGAGTSGRALTSTTGLDIITDLHWLEQHRIVAGVSVRRDWGQSPGDEQFTTTTAAGVRQKAAPDQTVYEAGVFVQDDWQATSWLKLTGSVRYGYFDYQSDPDAAYTPPGGIDPANDRYREQEEAWTGGLGAVVTLAEDWRVTASWARGYRFYEPAFGLNQTGQGYLAPSGFLAPIRGDQYELGLRHRSETFESSLVGYYTDLDGFQDVVPGSFNGQTFIDANNNNVQDAGEQVLVTVADGDAVLYGVEWDMRVDLNSYWDLCPEGSFLAGGFMWNYGRDLTQNQPMRHTHPARGLATLGYEEPDAARYYIELTADMVRSFTRVPDSRLNGDVGYRTDPQDPTSPLIRSDGLPGYTVFDLRMGYQLNPTTRIGLNIDNLTNKNYRSAHSRMDGFGIGARVFFEASF